MRDAFSLYFYYCKTSMKAWFQYRVDAFLRIFAVMARESTAVNHPSDYHSVLDHIYNLFRLSDIPDHSDYIYSSLFCYQFSS